MTVKQLREAIANEPDDVVVLLYTREDGLIDPFFTTKGTRLVYHDRHGEWHHDPRDDRTAHAALILR